MKCVKIKLIFLLCILFISLNLANNSQAAEYYVDASGGSDSNTGTSENTPWKTVARINSTSFGPGDYIYFKKGETWKETLTVSSSGSAGLPITFTAYGTAETKPTFNTAIVLAEWSGGPAVYTRTLGQLGLKMSMLYEDGFPLARASSSECSDGNWWWDGSVMYYRPKAGAPADHAVAYSTRYAAEQSGINVSGREFITIDGLRFVNNYQGIYALEGSNGSGPTKNLTVKNCEFLYSHYGIRDISKTDSINGLIDNNYFYRVAIASMFAAIGPEYGSHTRWSHTKNTAIDAGTIDGTAHWDDASGLYDYNGNSTATDLEGFTAQNAHDCIWTGNMVSGGYNHSFYIYTNGSRASYGNVIARNKVENNGSDSAIRMDGYSGFTFNNNRIANNLFINNAVDTYAHVIRLLQGAGTTEQNYFINNTIYGGYRGIYIDAHTPHYWTIKNNIVANTSSSNIIIKDASEATLIIDYNLYDLAAANRFITSSTGTWEQWKGFGMDAHSMISDPLFVSSSDFHLQPASPAIDAGTDVGLTTDFDGHPIVGAPDIGAYEYQYDIVPPAAPNGLSVN